MDKLQTAAVIILAAAAAARVIMFDTRGRTHRPLSAAIAYVTFVWLGSLAFCAAFGLAHLAVWLLIFGLALHTGAIIWAGGNISRIHPRKR
ncbi:phage holin family protein [Neisseria dentiae]|uniref:phage holin family protein n=1 Tax=Neisseria dentiae TaxID=194197 RepID=UPI00359F6875